MKQFALHCGICALPGLSCKQVISYFTIVSRLGPGVWFPENKSCTNFPDVSKIYRVLLYPTKNIPN